MKDLLAQLLALNQQVAARIERPSTVAATDETFKKAPESKKKHGEQSALEV